MPNHSPSNVELTKFYPRYLFVYGTLRRGFTHPIADFLQKNSNWIGEGFMEGRIFQLKHYPGALYEPGSENKVSGEVFEMLDPPAVLKVLDEYECASEEYPHPQEYVRKVCNILVQDTIYKCWVYLYNWPIIDTE